MGEAAEARRRRLRLRFRRKQRRKQVAMTIVDHLSELRNRIMVSLVAFVVVSSIAFAFYGPIEEFFRAPLCEVPRHLLGPQGCTLIFTKVTEGFQFRLKLTALVGLALTSPVWIYQLYAFIVPALTAKEKRYSLPFVFSSIALFVVGLILRFGNGAEALAWGIMFVVMPLGGVFYPVEALPAFIRPLSALLPTTHAFAAGRELIDGGPMPWDELALATVGTLVFRRTS